ncbi:hypothetical protein FA15DRAFT_493930 [Coprinopsis marcescibilis]|uniref:DUF6697 domain-containing protein n=1 Tax=Coprinopsis marcescibilis TaxID=230819 RepID=A0A5C3KRD7_COPMA|nr:hypothetical protein FA15DRAFT_493930 [Coprinopsis marcescibilis]
MPLPRRQRFDATSTSTGVPVGQGLTSTTELLALREEKERLRLELVHKDRELARLSAETQRAELLSERWTQDNNRFRDDLDRLRTDFQEQRQLNTELRQENSELRKDSAELRRQNAEFRTSQAALLSHRDQRLENMAAKQEMSQPKERSPSIELVEGPPALGLKAKQDQSSIGDSTCSSIKSHKRTLDKGNPPPSKIRRLLEPRLPLHSSSSQSISLMASDGGDYTHKHPSSMRQASLSSLEDSSPNPDSQHSTVKAASPNETPKKEDEQLSASTSQSRSLTIRQNVKMKDAAFSLTPEMMEHYLQGTPTLTIDPQPSGVYVPRKFLRLAYGGSDQHFLQYIQPDRNPSGRTLRNMVLPMLDMNPAMPLRPGEPGLMFASRHEILSNEPWSLFCHHLSSKKAVWRYLGEYESVLVGKMTATQFKAQRGEVQHRWAKLLVEQVSHDVYTRMRARIALRKAGFIPSGDGVKDEELVTEEAEAISGKRSRRPVNAYDIIQAFSRGDEGIDIIRMKCVKYDHVFMNDIECKFANYDQMLEEDKRKKYRPVKRMKSRGLMLGRRRIPWPKENVHSGSDSDPSSEPASVVPKLMRSRRSLQGPRPIMETSDCDSLSESTSSENIP